MSLQKKTQRKIQKRVQRRIFRTKNSQVNRGILPRVSVYRSLNHIYAQVIDDTAQSTLISFSSRNLKSDKKLDKTSLAKNVGLELGKKALEKSINKVFIDKGQYLYHGRLKALVEGLRESGMQV